MRKTFFVFSLFLFGVLFWSPTPVFAGRTCCESPGNDPTKCNACDPNTYWKNQGDDCGTDPSCKTCPSDHPVANACGGGTTGTGCRYASFSPKSLSLVQGQSGTTTFYVFADAHQINKVRFTSSDSSVVTIGAGHKGIVNAAVSWFYGDSTLKIQVNAENPGKATVKGEVVTAENTVCSSAVFTLVVTALPTPVPTPTLPPACSCDTWANGACNSGGCPTGSYPQSRKCSPSFCDVEVKCVANPACVPTPTPAPTATPLASISSHIETDPSLTGGVAPQLVGLIDPYCSSPSSGTAYSAGSIAASDNGGSTYSYPGSVTASGTYTITNLPQGNNTYCVRFTPSSPNIVCTCPTGCVYCGKDAPTTQDLKFYVSPVGTAWYQTVGGEIAAQATSGKSVSDPIAQTCVEPGCLPYLSLPFLSNLQTVGALITHQGASADLSDTAGSQANNVSPGGTSRNARLSTALVCRENYEYFYRLYSLGLSPANDFAYPQDAEKPTGAPIGGKPAYFYKGASLTIAKPWTVSSSESIVVFVKGSLTIANTVTVAPGGFLAFIISGNITVDPSVGTTDHASVTPGQVQGIYIANGAIQVKGNTSGGEEKKFIGEGTFAACNGIKIDRDFARGGAGLDNNKYPASLFLYRPDFMQNTPDRMKTSSYVWKEITP